LDWAMGLGMSERNGESIRTFNICKNKGPMGHGNILFDPDRCWFGKEPKIAEQRRKEKN